MRFFALSKENKASFVCPIFNVSTTMRACTRLRDMVYMGKKPPVRAGCQACIASSKCPAAEFIRKVAFGQDLGGTDMASDTEETVKIPAEILTAIHPVVVTETMMNRYNLTLVERELIESANPRIEAQLGHAPKQKLSSPRPVGRSTTRTVTKAEQPAVSSAVAEAAASGDMSAAINSGDAA